MKFNSRIALLVLAAIGLPVVIVTVLAMVKFLNSVPVDSFSQRPLRYAKRDRGYTIYSVGPDGRDDGGLEKREDIAEPTHYDVTFTVDR